MHIQPAFTVSTNQQQDFGINTVIGGESLTQRTVWGYYEQKWIQVKQVELAVLSGRIVTLSLLYTLSYLKKCFKAFRFS